MAQAISTTQNQNAQLLKTFMVAFVAMLVSVPIVTVITASVVKAQFGNVAYAQAAQQTNALGAGPSCAVPADEVAKNAAEAEGTKKPGVFSAWRWFPVSQSNYNSTSTTTNTTTSTDNTRVITKNNGNTTTDNRWSGNTLGLSLTDNRNSGNTTNTTTNNTNISDNGNTYTNIQDSGNTTNTAVTTNNVNTNVNSGNVISNDNDGIDVL